MDIEQKRSILRKKLKSKSKEFQSKRMGEIEIAPANLEEYPLSFTQRSLFLIDRMEGVSPQYNTPKAFRIEGEFNVKNAEKSLTKIIQKHQVLRTNYLLVNEKPAQYVKQNFSFKIKQFKLAGLTNTEQKERTSELMRVDAETAFDLEKDLLIRVSYLESAKSEGILLFNMHHIASDDWSMGILISEFVANYSALAQNKVRESEPLPLQYVDYAYWQNSSDYKRLLESQLIYWENQLKNLPIVHGLKLEKERPLKNTYSGAMHDAAISADVMHQLQEVALGHETTLFVVMHAAFCLLLARYSNSSDIVVGVPSANRRHSELEGLIGCFINTLVLRASTNFKSFKSYLEHIKQVNLEAQNNQDVPFEMLVDHCGVKRSNQYSPVVQIFLNMNSTDVDSLQLPSATLTPIEASKTYAKFDLTLNITVSDDGIVLSWLYNNLLFSEDRIGQMSRHFNHLLKTIIATPSARLNEIQILTSAELAHIKEQIEEVTIADLKEPFLHREFERQVITCPNKTALIFEGQTLSYAELNLAANRLAHQLLELGVASGAKVGLAVSRSANLVVGILAILKTGGAYVPLDPDYPDERIKHMIWDSKLQYLVAQSGFSEKIDIDRKICTINLDEADYFRDACGYPSINMPVQEKNSKTDHAYVIYTSGSTGKPKGVIQSHDNVLQLFHGTQDDFNFTENDVWVLFHSVSFDFSVWELWGALLYGGALVVPGKSEIQDAQRFTKLCIRHSVSVLNQTPSAFITFAQAALTNQLKFKALRLVIFGGEALYPSALDAWLKRYGDRHPALVNMYGITETTVHASFKALKLSDLKPQTAKKSVIGRSLRHQVLYLLDDDMNPVPKGVVGEIFIGGLGLSPGYLGQPVLTNKRFLANPFATAEVPSKLSRLYKTGDLAFQNDSGEYVYCGRNDNQVKIRGFRIEVGEVEYQIARSSAVQSATVRVFEKTSGDKHLVAYIVSKGSHSEIDLRQILHSELSKALPEHMIPSYLVFLESLPLTKNGKIDFKQLPDPANRREKSSIEPMTDLQRHICAIWSSVLEVENIGINDDFFDLGGHSLSAMRVVNQVQQSMREVIHLVTLFESPTVAKFCDMLIEKYPSALRKLGFLDDSASNGFEAPQSNFLVDKNAAQYLRKLVSVIPGIRSSQEARNPSAIFILSPPRSGSTLLRIMLAGHPKIFAPPELELLAFRSLAQRQRSFAGKYRFWLEGTIRALMASEQIDVETAKSTINDLCEKGVTTRGFYKRLQSGIGDQVLVDKTPSYSYAMEILQQAEADFENAKFIHLIRHPYGMISSFEKAHLEQLLFLQPHQLNARQLGELLWTGCHQNILAFLKNIPDTRQFSLKFEDLVCDPKYSMRQVCGFLDIPYHPATLMPYDGNPRRMTDGLYQDSRMLGDVKFKTHRHIDKAVATGWKSHIKEHFLGSITRNLTKEWGYDLTVRPSLPDISIGLKPPQSTLELSFAQKRLWFIDQIQGESHQYNIPVALKVDGEFDVTVAERVITKIIERHETLRTVFRKSADKPEQVILDKFKFSLRFFDLQSFEKSKREEKITELITQDALQSFDLQEDLLVRASFAALSDRSGVLIFNMHHIASDGWSMGVLIREFGVLYKAELEGLESLAPIPLQYRHYTQWQKQWLTEDVLSHQLEYWRRQLLDAPPVHQLPLDYPRSAHKKHAGDVVLGHVSPALAKRLESLATEQGITLFILLHAAFALVLCRHSNSKEILIGSPVANRPRVELESMIGFFVNTLTFRTDVRHDSLRDYLAHVKEVVLAGQEHQDIPFEYLIEKLNIPRSTSYTPLFQITFTLNTKALAGLTLPGIRFAPIQSPLVVAKSDIDLSAQVNEAGIEFSWMFDRSLFKLEQIRNFNSSLECLLARIVDSPEVSLRDLSVLPDEQFRYLTAELNATHLPYPENKLLHELFEQQVVLNPNAIAATCEDQKLSYQELNQQANRLAHYFLEQGVIRGNLIGLCVDRSIEMLVGMLGILKAGAAYLPLDPEYPEERIKFMLDDSSLSTVVTQSHLMHDMPFEECRFVIIDAELNDQLYSSYPEVNIDKTELQLTPQDLAYVIYTSGSTGQPKGVLIEHSGVVNMIAEQQRIFNVTVDSNVLQFASLSFDASVSECLMALLSGATLHICVESDKRDPKKLGAFLVERNISHATIPPALLHYLELHSKYKLECIIVAGEACDDALAWRWSENYNLFNAYGPTEASVCVSVSKVKPGEPLNIGFPIANTECYVLGINGELVPSGTEGELVVGGVGLARGYLNRPKLTKIKFIQNRFSESEYLYRTGDLVRRLPDGRLVFVGRADGQVKVRGFRVELREVERCLNGLENVLSALVICSESESGISHLIAYVVPLDWVSTENSDAFSASLKQELKSHLPKHMVPDFFVLLESMPLSPNGKIDLKALPKADFSISTENYVAPSSELEKQLCTIWQDLLKLKQVGVKDGFFELGGHSLLAVRLVSEIRQRLRAEVDIAEIFDNQTVSELATLIAGRVNSLDDKQVITSRFKQAVTSDQSTSEEFEI